MYTMYKVKNQVGFTMYTMYKVQNPNGFLYSYNV